jgi:predicted nuclease of predicted toxin-antitoxin system
MSLIKFYTDVHISREAVRQLQLKGVDIIHCGDVGMSDADDTAHLEYATQNGRVMITCDADFEQINAAWQAASRPHGGIVYITSGEKCKAIGEIVKEILFLHQASDYETDVYNKVWRA